MSSLNMQDGLQIGVVGVGALGRHHARILSQMPDVRLVGVADSNQQQGETVAAQCGCEWTSDYRSLIGEVDAVSLVVPTTLHRAIAEEFLAAGVPVLVEKPLTANVADGRHLVQLARQQDLILQVGHIERFNPAFQALQKKIGSPRYLRAERLSPYAFRSMDIGVVHDLMIHDLELVLALVGEMPDQVEAFGVSLLGGFEDCVQARLKFPGGCIADITANRVSPSVSRAIQCWSENGCATADLQSRTVTSYSPGEPLLRGDLPFELVRDRRCSAEELKPVVFSQFIQQEQLQMSDEDALTAELRSFVQCVRTGQSPLVSGVQALAALQVAEQVLQAVAEHAWDGAAGSLRGPDALLAYHLKGTTEAGQGRAA